MLGLQTTKPATPFNPFGNTSTGIIGSINKATGLAPQAPPVSAAPAPITQGTSPGLLHVAAPKSNVASHTVTTSPDGTTVTKQTFNNGQASGSVKGAITPKPAAASNPGTFQIDTSIPPPASQNGTPTPAVAPEAPTNKYNTTTGLLNPNYKDPNAPTAPAPASLDTPALARGVLTSGQQTPGEKQAQQSVTQAGQMSPEELAANQAVAEANRKLKEYQNVQTLSPYAEAGLYTGHAPSPTDVQNMVRAPDLAGRASADTGLATNLGNIYGTANVAGADAALAGVQTAAARGLSGAQTNLGAEQNIASRGTGAAENVFGAGLVSPTTPGQAAFSGLNGYGTNANQFGNPGDPATAANYQSYIKAVGDNNNIGVASTAFDTNFNKAISDAQQVSSLLSPQQKKTPLENLLNLIANGSLGNNPALSGLLNDITAIKTSYRQATGNELVIPPTATLDQLNSIKSSAQSAIKAAQSANQNLIDKYTSPSSSKGSTGDFSWDFLKGL